MSLMDSDISVLLIEDDEVDIKNIKYNFKEYNIKNNLIIAKNGDDALNLLFGKKKFKRPIILPAMILLDINMPKVNGFEFLRDIHNQADLARIPIIITTTSDSQLDKKLLKEFNIAGYFVKPLNFKNFFPLYKQIVDQLTTFSRN